MPHSTLRAGTILALAALACDGTESHQPAGGYGSALAFAPDETGTIYLLTDRGPNTDLGDGKKQFAFPGYSPRIVRARIVDGRIEVLSDIPLRRSDGTPITGLPHDASSCGANGEQAIRTDGSVIAPDSNGLDSEGLVAMGDGTFWVSDEYGPFLVHFDRDGRELSRLSPCDGSLPAIYAKRRPNRGMEGLTVTPDGEWLVGIMQAPLENPSPTGVRNVSRLTRILFRHLTSGAIREYAYMLEDSTIEGNSEIHALSSTQFLVIERDALFPGGSPPSVMKRVYEVDIAGATELNAIGALGMTPVAGRTIEQATMAELASARVVPVTKTLRLDLLAAGFPHDKAEGMAFRAPEILYITNDDDFGVMANSAGRSVPKRRPLGNVLDVVELRTYRIEPRQ